MSRPRCLRRAGLVARVPYSRLVPEGHRSLVRLPRGHVRLDVFQVRGLLRSGQQFSRHGGKFCNGLCSGAIACVLAVECLRVPKVCPSAKDAW